MSKDKTHKDISKRLYLQHILTRLETEYIEILKMVTDYNLTHERGIGFWSLTRIIFPVIESVADVLNKQKGDFLGEDLKVPFSHLVWDLYRNSLIHSDEMREAIYKGKTISWGVHLGNELENHFVAEHHESRPTTLHISIPRLYFDLRDFLISEIARNDESQITVQVGVEFSSHKSKIIDELEELYKK